MQANGRHRMVDTAGLFARHPQGCFLYARRGRKEADMAENEAAQAAAETQEQEQAHQPAAKPQGAEVDWKVESRKWEARAKKSEAAEAELEALKQEKMTEQEKATARAEKAEAELASIKAEQQRMADAREVATVTGVPAELLEFCTDRDAMEQFARIYGAKQPTVHSAATAKQSSIVRGGEGKVDNPTLFAQTAEQFFK